MLLKNVSGQFLYFSLVSALSGNQVTGASGNISGRKSLDGLSGMIVLSGNIIELGGGSYRANLFDFDTNGNYAGYLFTASGCVPVQYSLVTMGGVSGQVFLGSGSITSGLIASGIVFPASGAFATVLPATLSGVVANSGLTVTVLPATISGTFATVPIDTISGAIGNSGQFVTVPPATLSGVIANSGLFVTVPPATISGVWANSGLFVTLPKATISGVVPDVLSGTVQIASGPFVNAAVTVNSGLFVTVPIESISGVIANSGLFVTVPKATISGVIANSGLFVTVPPATISGVVANSGLFATVLPANLSGVVVNSGLSVTVASGLVYLASGQNAVEIPKAVHTWDYSGAPDVSGIRCLVNAQRKLINKWDLTSLSGKLVVYKENDSTTAYTQDVGSTSGAAPVTSLDTN
jgi:hypothetical protein